MISKRPSSCVAEYASINRQYFEGQLPTVPVEWVFLTERYGETEHGENGYFKINVDPPLNPDIDRLRETLEHESCHVYVISRYPSAEDHGVEWQTCMSRF
jgi:predicted SprT family Zn-dependent metalloprotease